MQCETETIEGNMYKKSKTYTYTVPSEKDFSTLGIILGTEMELHYITLKIFNFSKYSTVSIKRKMKWVKKQSVKHDRNC